MVSIGNPVYECVGTMNKNQKTPGLFRLIEGSTNEEMRSRLKAAAEVNKVVQETPDTERLVRREKFAFTSTFAPDPDSVLQEPASENIFGVAQGSVVGKYRLVCDVSRKSDGALWLVKDHDVDGPTMVLRLLCGRDLSEFDRWRLQGESQVISRLNNAGCSRLISFGSTDDGLIYRVSEFISGVPIAVFCDDESLSIHDRVSLFIEVCDIVAAVHANGTAGLEFSSVDLISQKDGNRSSVKLVDFRIRDAAIEHDADASVAIQADLRSLGLVLLELLTGLSPAECLAAAAESVPPRPSQLLRKRCFAVPSVARKRGAEPSQVVNTVSGVLDAAVMKCLGRDSASAYASVNRFARDVRQFLDEPDETEDSWIQKLTGRRRPGKQE